MTGRTQATADVDRLQDQVVRQRKEILELTSELHKPGSLTPGSANLTPALVLDSELTRGKAKTARLSIVPDAHIVTIGVRLSTWPNGTLTEELITFDGQQKWTQVLLPSEAERSDKMLSISLPAYLLTPDDYRIIIRQDKSSQPIANASFRVPRGAE